jgi:predicted phage terminase large subunit-like protein
MDLAFAAKERRDYCAFVVGGMSKDGMLYIRHVLKERMDAMQVIETIFMLFKKYPADQVVMESGSLEKAIGPFLKAEMMRRGIFLPLLTFPSTVEKVQRARSIQARMRAGGVKFDKRKLWFVDLENEMLRFPKDIHDDQVDAMALLGQTLDKMQDAPTNKEITDEDWLEENEQFLAFEMNQGKSQVTGY